MTKLSKILLTVAVAGLAGGSIIDLYFVKANPALAAVLPLGAIASGLFMIVFMLEKEVAKYDEEQAGKMQLLQHRAAPSARQQTPAAPPITVQLKEKTT